MTTLMRRRATWLAMAVALLLGVAPFSALADSHVASRTEVAFTSTLVEIVQAGEETVDEAGIFHVRGEVTREEISGDISGTAIITANFDFQPVGECTEESCPGYFSFWARVEITGEDGGWVGTYVSQVSDVPGEEYFVDGLVLRGTGANAGMSIVAESVEGTEDSISFVGVLSTLAKPIRALNTRVHLCAAPEDFSFGGGFLSSGAIEGSGGATGDFLVGGGPWTHTYAVAGMVTLTDENGSVTVAFGGSAQDTFTQMFDASHVWGHFVILEGTGNYADLYASGRLVATAGGPDPLCESGFGINLSMVGEAHYN